MSENESVALPEVGDMIYVHWGMFGIVRVEVTKVTRFNNVYGKRWNQRRKEWTSSRRLDNWRGYWELWER